MTYHYNKKSERTKRKELRNNATEAEKELWRYLKGKQIAGIKFRRQYSVDSYILDFYAPGIKLGIEIDGPTHFTSEGIEYDEERSKYIEGFGIRILRYTNGDVYNCIDGVLQEIENTIREMIKSNPSLSPLAKGRQKGA